MEPILPPFDRKKRLSSSLSKFVLFLFLKNLFYSRDIAISLDNSSDKKKLVLQKERSFFLNPSSRPTRATLGRFQKVCLLSLAWQNEFMAFLDGTLNRKLMPANTDVISRDLIDISRWLRRSDEKQGLNEVLRNELKVDDFVLLDEELMDYLISKYRGVKIIREVLTPKENPHIDYFPLRVLIFLFTICIIFLLRLKSSF